MWGIFDVEYCCRIGYKPTILCTFFLYSCVYIYSADCAMHFSPCKLSGKCVLLFQLSCFKGLSAQWICGPTIVIPFLLNAHYCTRSIASKRLYVHFVYDTFAFSHKMQSCSLNWLMAIACKYVKVDYLVITKAIMKLLALQYTTIW